MDDYSTNTHTNNSFRREENILLLVNDSLGNSVPPD